METGKIFKKIHEVNPNNILLMIKEKENRRLLKNTLAEDYQVIIPKSEEELFDQSFDLIMVDEYVLNEYENTLQEIRNNVKPVFLPILLITSQNNNAILYKELQTLVNDLIRTPVGKLILKTRIKNLMHIRKLSLESDQRYHELAEESPVGICILQNQKIVYGNPAFFDICGKENREIFVTPFIKYVYNTDKKKVKKLFDNRTEKSEEIRIINNNNSIRWVDFRSTNITYKDKKSILVMVLDITDKKKSESKIKYLSFHDKLTNLYNRNFFEEEIRRLNTERQFPLSIIMGDVNGLKLVNDAFGHQRGNLLLKKIADILKQNCRSEDIIARWGGDEFVILLPKTLKKTGENICNRIRKTCFKAEKNPIQLSIALGVATKDSLEIDIEDILKKAEDRMYKNKLAGNESIRNSIISSLENTLLEKSHETKEHAERMNKLALKFSKKLDLSTSIVDELKILSKLHDIGKVSIPERILKKPGKLTQEEYEIIKGHSGSGYRIIKAVPELAAVAESILTHHERWDGTGYPRGLEKESIPYTARIIAIIDSYDVMTHDRTYKKAFSQKKALAEIERCAGSQFDPELAEIFIGMIRNGS